MLFTDIVDSTRSAAAMGDERWLRLLGDHDHIAREWSVSIAAIW